MTGDVSYARDTVPRRNGARHCVIESKPRGAGKNVKRKRKSNRGTGF
jgi:hypothetical protein